MPKRHLGVANFAPLYTTICVLNLILCTKQLTSFLSCKFYLSTFCMSKSTEIQPLLSSVKLKLSSKLEGGLVLYG